MELIAEILEGSQAAMEVLVKRYYKIIFSYVYRSTGNYHTSYDLTQEVFVKMMKSIDKFEGRGNSFKNWLFKIALNNVRDYFKGSRYRAFKETTEFSSDIPDENIVELIPRMQRRDEIKKAILQLPEVQRDTIILRFYNDMKIKDIAKVMDTTESTVKSRLRLGLGKLKDILKEEEKEDESKFGF